MPLPSANKIANEGATAQGRFSASEFNDLINYTAALPIDIQINGSTILNSSTHIANIPLASSNTTGVITSNFYANLSGMYEDYNDNGFAAEDHTHTASDVTDLGTAATKNVGVANGVAGLNASGVVPVAQLPSIATTKSDWNATEQQDGYINNKPSVPHISAAQTYISESDGTNTAEVGTVAHPIYAATNAVNATTAAGYTASGGIATALEGKLPKVTIDAYYNTLPTDPTYISIGDTCIIPTSYKIYTCDGKTSSLISWSETDAAYGTIYYATNDSNMYVRSGNSMVKINEQFAAYSHTHSISGVTGLSIALLSKINKPSSEGTSGQVLTTDGSGVYTWADKDSFINVTTLFNAAGNTISVDTSTDKICMHNYYIEKTIDGYTYRTRVYAYPCKPSDTLYIVLYYDDALYMVGAGGYLRRYYVKCTISAGELTSVDNGNYIQK